MPGNKASEKIVTRFAPSPTGFMHVGGVRTALYAWLLARKNNGSFILRIEDTDKEREVAGSIEHIVECLKWLELNFDQGPFIQSERLDLYKKYAHTLIDKGFAYPDPYTKEELEEFRKKADAEKRPFLYRDHRPEKFGAWDEKQALRFKTPEIKSYKWHDLVYGDLSAGPEALDDFILIKADGYPTYNFAHIVDDIEMNVSHVMRGVEFIASTPKFLSVYEAFGLTPPLYATLPVILGPDGNKKLSKRDGAKDLLDYRKEGYLPDAMINYLAFLGFNPGGEKEIYTREELIEAFDLTKVQHSGAKWDDKKLDWMNKEHMKMLTKDELQKYIFEHLPEQFRSEKIIPIIAERISKWSDVDVMVGAGELDFFMKAPSVDRQKLIFKKTPEEKIKNNLELAIKTLEGIEETNFSTENIKTQLLKVAEKLESRGELLHPVRYALSGRDQSPDPFIIASIIGKNETISRLQKAL